MNNRQLKFRCWDKLAKQFTYPDKGYQGHYVLTLNGQFQNLQNGSGGDEYVVQQFTELYDKNKKPIYEGDRVKFSYTGDYVFYGEVIWLKYSASFVVRTVNASETFAFDDLMDPLGLYEDTIDCVQYLEVIGNIFEHPELLKNE